MEDVQPQVKIQDILGYALAYACWLINAALSMLGVLLIRNATNAMWPVFGTSNQWRWTLGAVDRFGVVFLGLVWLAFVIWLEQYYRSAITVTRQRREGRRVPPEARVNRERLNIITHLLTRLGLDVLVRRFGITLIVPAATSLLGYLGQQLAFWLLFRAGR